MAGCHQGPQEGLRDARGEVLDALVVDLYVYGVYYHPWAFLCYLFLALVQSSVLSSLEPRHLARTVVDAMAYAAWISLAI